MITSEQSKDFRALLHAGWPDLSTEVQDKVCRYYEMVLAENEVQNLTRMSTPRDFYEGHVLDVQELLKSKMMDFPAVDLGSGAGVPGLLAAIINPEDRWTLVDSEKKKAEFLSRAEKELELSNVVVRGIRIEEYLKTKSCESVVIRAVGPIDRIFAWIEKCSTWNNLILLKGPKWEEEWATFQKTSAGRRLKIAQTHKYEAGSEKKQRTIIKLARVPRRTESEYSK